MNGNLLTYVGQKAFIDRDGEVLVLHDPNIGVDFPGGKIQDNETDIVESLKREVREETGLEIEVGDQFYSWLIKFPKNPRYDINHVYLVGFKCKYISGETKLSEEHTKYRWVNKDNYRELNDGKPHFKALEKYFETQA